MEGADAFHNTDFKIGGTDAGGKSTKGIINADSARAARTKLRQDHLFPTDLVETSQEDSARASTRNREVNLFSRVRPQDITIMTRQFATLLAASLTVVDALTALIEQTENAPLKKTLIQVRESVNEGSSLADGLEAGPTCGARLGRDRSLVDR